MLKMAALRREQMDIWQQSFKSNGGGAVWC
jgi:hypothetical protein